MTLELRITRKIEEGTELKEVLSNKIDCSI